MALADNTERLVEQLNLKTRSVTDERILKDAFIALEKSSPYARKITVKNNIVAKLIALAAVVALVIGIWSVVKPGFNENLTVPKQIYNNLIKSNNFNISIYHADESQPFEQLYSVKSVDMKLFINIEANNELLTLWDTSRNDKMSSDTSSKSVQTLPITKNMLNELEESMFQIFSLKQFKNINDIPKNAKWQPVLDEKINNKLPDTQVYQLSWQKKSFDGKIQYFKWLFFITINSDILKRTELYIKSNNVEQYELDSISTISYQDDQYIKNLILENFGPIINAPEYRPTGI